MPQLVQFFEVASGPSSPRKRRKVESDSEDDHLVLSQDGYVDAMPGYHEDDEDETGHGSDIRHLSDPTMGSNPEDPAEHPAEPTPFSDQSGKSRPTSRKESDDGVQEQTCPICSKTMQTDNRGLNAHIDFCLSKGAIREAQAMASGSVSKNTPSAPPTSTSKKSASTALPGRKKTKR